MGLICWRDLVCNLVVVGYNNWDVLLACEFTFTVLYIFNAEYQSLHLRSLQGFPWQCYLLSLICVLSTFLVQQRLLLISVDLVLKIPVINLIFVLSVARVRFSASWKEITSYLLYFLEHISRFVLCVCCSISIRYSFWSSLHRCFNSVRSSEYYSACNSGIMRPWDLHLYGFLLLFFCYAAICVNANLIIVQKELADSFGCSSDLSLFISESRLVLYILLFFEISWVGSLFRSLGFAYLHTYFHGE